MAWKELDWKKVEGSSAVPRADRGRRGLIDFEMKPLPDGGAEVSLTADEEGRRMFERCRELLADRVPDGDPVKVLEIIAETYLEDFGDAEARAKLAADRASRGEHPRLPSRRRLRR